MGVGRSHVSSQLTPWRSDFSILSSNGCAKAVPARTGDGQTKRLKKRSGTALPLCLHYCSTGLRICMLVIDNRPNSHLIKSAHVVCK